MISFDTNLLLYSLNQDCAEYGDARGFFASLPATMGSVVICELVLVELYVQSFRQHPTWRLIETQGIKQEPLHGLALFAIHPLLPQIAFRISRKVKIFRKQEETAEK